MQILQIQSLHGFSRQFALDLRPVKLFVPDLKLLQLRLLCGFVRPPVSPDVGQLLHLLQPLGQAQEPLADLLQPAQRGVQLGLRLLQTALVGPPLVLGRVQRSVLDLRDAPGDHFLSAGQHGGEQGLTVGAVLLQELEGKQKDIVEFISSL